MVCGNLIPIPNPLCSLTLTLALVLSMRGLCQDIVPKPTGVDINKPEVAAEHIYGRSKLSIFCLYRVDNGWMDGCGST
jgi:hypothetical protein